MTTKAAHIRGTGVKVIHGLEDHLESVGEIAAEFAASFGSAGWAELAGRWHDLGKYSDSFQRMIYAAHGMDAGVLSFVDGPRDHSTAGAVHAVRKFGDGAGSPLAAVIAGHHGGLQDLNRLEQRLVQKASCLTLAEAGDPPASILAGELPLRPRVVTSEITKEFWTRMLFSCLVDADRLDTERFFDPVRADSRGQHKSLTELRAALNSYLSGLPSSGVVNGVRARVLQACRMAGSWSPGAFSLTVPTGGGKTLASMAFALEHALGHNKTRVVVVAPFMSLVEQTASSLREAIGDVVEHYSASEPQEDNLAGLACENWDAPVIVTTTVQFFESLFAKSPRSCRKLHNLVNSVIVLDEAQALPVELLLVLVDGLRTLVENYGVSVVVSTATQPALGVSKRLTTGLREVREINSEHRVHTETLRRVSVSWRTAAPVPLQVIADEVAGEDDVLVVVHRKKDATDLLDLVDSRLGNDHTYHLSSWMCPAHRQDVVSLIRRAGVRRVVSTQLVEAGLDLDFAVVYRAMGGIDSMTQAAGRCNREGRRPRGDFRVFLAESSPPPGLPQQGLAVTKLMLQENPDLDIFDPETHRRYFQKLVASGNLDRGREIQRERERRNFEVVARGVRFIDDRESLMIPYKDGALVLEEILRQGPKKFLLRSAQKYMVQVPTGALESWVLRGLVERDPTGTIAYLPAWQAAAYDQRRGLRLSV